MGLDQYCFKAPSKILSSDVEFSEEWNTGEDEYSSLREQREEVMYWRKNNALHAWMDGCASYM